MNDEELDALCDTCPHKDKVNEYGDCSAPADFACPQIEVYVREKKVEKMSFMSELLDRCENSDDADKRELAVYVNKLDAIRDSLEKQLWLSKDETTRAQNTEAAMKVKLNELKARIKEEDAELHAADDEIDELHEKYRWRKQEEEPAPDGLLVEEISPEMVGAYGGRINIVVSDLCRSLCSNSFWRPLDLPEEERK